MTELNWTELRFQHTNLSPTKFLTLLSHLISTEIMAHTTDCLELYSFVFLSISSRSSHSQIIPRVTWEQAFGFTSVFLKAFQVKLWWYMFQDFFPHYTPCCPKNAFHFNVKKVDKPYTRAYELCRFSRVRLFGTPWTVARQDPLSTGFSKQEYWTGMPCPSAGDLSDPGTELAFLTFPPLGRWALYH